MKIQTRTGISTSDLSSLKIEVVFSVIFITIIKYAAY